MKKLSKTKLFKIVQSGGFLIYLDLALIEAALRAEVEAVKQCIYTNISYKSKKYLWMKK